MNAPSDDVLVAMASKSIVVSISSPYVAPSPGHWKILGENADRRSALNDLSRMDARICPERALRLKGAASGV